MRYKFIFVIFVILLLSTEAMCLRIISTAPNITEILISLGMGGEIVGITDYCPKPNEKAQSVGNINLDHEKIIMIAPDVIFAIKGFNSDLERIEKIIATIKYLKFESIKDIVSSIKMILKKSGKSEQHELINKFQNIKPIFKNPKKVFIQIWDTPFMTVGKKSFITDFLKKLGLNNVFADVDRSFFEVNIEELLRRNPDIVIVSQDKYFDQEYYKNGILKFLSAVQNNHLIQIPSSILLRPGPSLLKAVSLIKDKLNNAK